MLGPLLFLVYVNDLPLTSKFNTKLFANDITLTMSNKCLDTLNKNMNNKLCKIYDSMKINKLSINKTKFMIISSKKAPHNVKISIGKHKIDELTKKKN